MGGQACVIYGAAEFSRDTDLAILSDADNLTRLGHALADLQAERIAVPPFAKSFLDAGLAVHFRCRRQEANGLRIDVMSKMRGVDPFDLLWERRTTRTLDRGLVVDLLSLPDLVQSKKTQRDKDWPMLRRLLEADYFSTPIDQVSDTKIEFWLRELRTPELLVEIAGHHRQVAERLAEFRPLLEKALTGDLNALEQALQREMATQVALDRAYWAPLKAELERLRRLV
jgi:hypothetical protein